MKKVFTNSEIVHKFNEQSQCEGNTPNHGMFFYNTKLYSYGHHYLLSEFIDKETILINDKGYSNSTGKHISLVTSATSDKKQYFITKTDTKIVLYNLKHWFSKLPRARTTKQFYINQINSTFNMYFDFVEYTKQKTKFKKDSEHRQILKLYNSFINDFDNLEQQIKEQQIKEAKKAKKEIVQKLKDWKANEIDWFRNKTNKDYLRLKDGNIETSQNVKITINEGQRLLRLIDLKNIVGQRVDNSYIVKSFNSLLTIGCHKIPLSEIKYIRKQLKNL